MSVRSLPLALQGAGFPLTPIALAVQGLVEGTSTPAVGVNPFPIAVQGAGFPLTPIALAVQGLLKGVSAVQTSPTIAPFVSGGGGRGGGPDAQLSLSDYLKKFGKSTALPAAVSPVQTPAQRTAALKKRQRMEEEVLALADIF